MSCESKSCQLQKQVELDARQSLAVAHPATPSLSPVNYCWFVSYFISMCPCSICTSCRIRSHASVKEMSEGERNVQFHGVVVLSTEIVLVDHFRPSSPSLMTAQSLSYIGHCDEKLCGLNKEKSVAVVMSLEWSQLHFTAIIYDHKASNSANFTKIGRILSEITGSNQ